MSVERRRTIGDAIFVDEIGIEYGIHGDFRLRSAYQPIYAPHGGSLHPVAVEGLIEPHRAGRPGSPRMFFDSVAASDRLFVETMCRMLHLRNFHNIGVDRLDLFFNYNPLVNDHAGRALAEIRLMSRHLDELGLAPAMLVCEITEQAADDALLARLVREMRRDGIRIAIDDFGTGHSTEERVSLLQPDIVKIDGGWFAEFCRHAAAERFFRPLVSSLHDRGAKVLVEGIEQPTHLRVALEGGVDLLQGFLLGRPALAGTIFNEEPLAVDVLLGFDNKVVPLHKRR
ncbi:MULTISPECIES: EAL domain-containing protein [unclassified Mesorhizobium]|uniref:EAL domain-containing protein n=1 Tax=unclassified Mesorhizobium TaxID=325217 RepID=UPI000FD7D45B|nr:MULTISPECIES: EAL domain-containing protein [unclassified Mesorhizobium]TGR37008.1 EAL domain-containing protein [bacterium M00.F.Ca.ET.199.01.1.1]TGU18154.1 EAL domain-containing protein [bacterium M00.F.Ca.ET.156.01.1.1]TGV08321.1 EAL domain-containing protein [Mesorhizobium sp. M8A.F.Ca.ET.173.01.1.1]TGV57655.1 EAL domain-containing protein [bacterium M00.F.Ca.ET.141.01.1.1]TGV82189.1 EAL domain-containing protein [Mesorhizobium sp. M00.F.Ca.ET.149.01.1.1]TIU47470.1 MAG: EAL domain-cont